LANAAFGFRAALDLKGLARGKELQLKTHGGALSRSRGTCICGFSFGLAGGKPKGIMKSASKMAVLVLGTIACTGCGVQFGLDARHFGREKPGVLAWEDAKALEAKRPGPKASPEASPEYNDTPTSSGGQKLEASKLRYNSLKAN
jgi:hypothetical protein